MFLRRSEWESAAAEFEAALDGNWRDAPNRAAAWKGLAQARLKLGRPDESLEAAQQAITGAPEDAEAWRLHGATQEALDLRNEALASYGRAFLLDPSDPITRSALDRLVPK